MQEKKQRTVYRLTLVKSWNMEEAESYVELIEKGQPGGSYKLDLTFSSSVSTFLALLLFAKMLPS